MTALITRDFDYADGETACRGWLCLPEGLTGPAPAVLMAPAFQGVIPGMKANAEKLAATGRPVLLLDPYGVEEMARDVDPMVRMQGMVADRAGLRARLVAALDAFKALPEIDTGRIAAAGYCFGGLCALDLARAAPEGLVGAVSLHGVFTPSPLPANPISAKVLVLHGWDDPLATPDTVLALADELTAAGADWQIHAYGRTVHAFTTPGANTPGRAMYSPDADRRSFQAMGNFLTEVLDG
ncbi:MAG: dienelactone hydrolase family protein [Pseudomonadota bacterium]|nr:dienelactone hydrolase family protein [Pseudomonadota bacterium]